MKPALTQIALCVTFSLTFFSCRKDAITPPASDQTAPYKRQAIIDNVKNYLQKAMKDGDYTKLDWSNASLQKKEDTVKYIIIPFTNTETTVNTKIIVSVNGNSFSGNFFSLSRDVNTNKLTAITTTSFDKTVKEISHITNGFAVGKDRFINGKPEPVSNIILIASDISPIEIWYYNQLYMLFNSLQLFSNSSPSTLANLQFGSFGGGNPNGGGGNNAQGDLPEYEMLDVEIEVTDYSEDAVDINKLFNCFNLISDNGATYELTLCDDIPVNSDPDWPINYKFSYGHSFLTLKKTNGNQSVTQAFGFFPVYETLDDVPSKIVDASGHEINASIKMSLNQNQFDLFKNNCLNYSTTNYNAVSNNCVNFALDIFNSVRPAGSEINIDIYQAHIVIPTIVDTWVFVPKSPQELFKKLQQMSTPGNPESNNIHISQTHNYQGPVSHGVCP